MSYSRRLQVGALRQYYRVRGVFAGLLRTRAGGGFSASFLLLPAFPGSRLAASPI